MMFADDVVLCAREKDELELELEQWREALEKSPGLELHPTFVPPSLFGGNFACVEINKIAIHGTPQMTVD